ncbi:hypothetical protein A2127_01125 [Candidatus Jorgensenbacteria bacterium GWC1_48_12]|uniref:Methenyltetrahydrofolate cyclohydrolase n=1 Tax=Candidatus Jorgensenbacteria bacterium GWC1_48_12 TaxID=1798469 RepID=A0A1F6BRT7_9BACT|nr:MAG: hypothetical protein A2127_01125 [Candidatus Jorgensenbacteria bacterium GWC1_48_12]
MIIDGKTIAGGIIAELKNKPKPEKFLAVVLVGEEPSMMSFIRQKEKIAKIIGVDFRLNKFPEEVKNDELKESVREIAGIPDCGGLVLQLPLPAQINRDEIIEIIPAEKDVDNLTGRAPVSAPAVGVVETVIENCKLKIENLRVAVVGLGLLVGGPVSKWLEGKCAGLQTLNSSGNLEVLKQADLVVSGVGFAGLIKPDTLKDGAVVIDFGYDFKDGKTSGDFDASGIRNSELPARNASHSDAGGKIRNLTYTPTPGGTGPILVAKLFENFYKLNR